MATPRLADLKLNLILLHNVSSSRCLSQPDVGLSGVSKVATLLREPQRLESMI